jgi:hypothetical protein
MFGMFDFSRVFPVHKSKGAIVYRGVGFPDLVTNKALCANGFARLQRSREVTKKETTAYTQAPIHSVVYGLRRMTALAGVIHICSHCKD